MIENNDKQIVLSKKESQILSLIVSGRTSTQIAEMVGKAIKAGFY